MSAKGFRLLAVAYRIMTKQPSYHVEDEESTMFEDAKKVISDKKGRIIFNCE